MDNVDYGACRFQGVAWAIPGRFQVGLEGSAPSHGIRPDLAAAARLRLNSAMVVRVGWLEIDGSAALPSIGATFQVSHWDLDYAYRGSDALGGTHHLGVGYEW